MDESTTRRRKIDPALYAVGWELNAFPESQILNEQRAYLIAPGRVEKFKARHPKKVDYILEYKGIKLAVVEAKSDETNVSVGVPQAKQYAEMLQIRYAYSTNGDEIYFIDMGVKDAACNYTCRRRSGLSMSSQRRSSCGR
jgi:type I restriction enzyme R subunit